MARTVRFWAFVNGGRVKLSLRPGEMLRRTWGGPTDEGYCWNAEHWFHAGDHLEHAWAQHSRDCDGRYEDGGVRYWPLEDGGWRVMLEDAGGFYTVPAWQDDDAEGSYHRDYTAEAAGY